ncbi:WG repeat-containing protein [Dyadobacter sp. CY312]|uniref:WG repeat-containing protein n=1 Tax=Dyadobacter sp. CY312 TaxID=2907303 RepID=UPI001F353E9E|nr:WG repeat-containing protein [Dyadobacter sp. CY312]MCE7042340.1 WG repeat-containing protein [Dyadobacter sp. CY312]
MKFLIVSLLFGISLSLHFNCNAQLQHGFATLKFPHDIEKFSIKNFRFASNHIRLSEVPAQLICQEEILYTKLDSKTVSLSNLEIGHYGADYLYKTEKYIYSLDDFSVELGRETIINVKVTNKEIQQTGGNCDCDINCDLNESKYFTKHTKIPSGFSLKWVEYHGDSDFYRKNGGIMFLTDGKFNGVLNNKGQWLVEPKFTDIQTCSNSEFIYQVKINDKIGYFNINTQKFTVPVEYQDTRVNYIGGYYILKKDGKYGVIDSLNKIVIPFNYENIVADGSKNFEEYSVKQNKKYALFRLGMQLTDFKYDNLYLKDKDDFCHYYSINGKFGYLLSSGKELTEPIFTLPSSFKGNRNCTSATLDGREVLINKNGKVVDSDSCN